MILGRFYSVLAFYENLKIKKKLYELHLQLYHLLSKHKRATKMGRTIDLTLH